MFVEFKNRGMVIPPPKGNEWTGLGDFAESRSLLIGQFDFIDNEFSHFLPFFRAAPRCPPFLVPAHRSLLVFYFADLGKNIPNMNRATPMAISIRSL